MFEHRLQIILFLSLAGTKVLAKSGVSHPATPCDDPKAPGGVWQEGCLVQTCKAGTVVKSLAEECLKLIEQQIEDVLDKNKDQNVDDVLEGNSTGKELLYFGNTIVELPSFEPVSECQVPPHPTKDLTLATTGVLDGKVFTCGGTVGNKWPPVYSSNCHKLEKGTWSAQPDMKQQRTRAASSVTSNGEWLVTGGKNLESDALASTEIYKNGVWENGPELPVRMLGHCQLTTKSGVIVAGFDMDEIQNFLVLRLEGGEWKKLKEEKWRMQKWWQRFGHSCQMLPDGRLAVIGGYGDRVLNRFDILDLNTLKWSEGPKLPFEVYDDFSAIYKDTLYIIEQESGDVYSLSTNLDGDWVKIKNIKSLLYREVFPAPIVKQNDVC